MVYLKATSPQVLCCAPRLELLWAPLPPLSVDSQPSKALARLAAFTPHVAVCVGRQRCLGSSPATTRVWRGDGKGRIAQRGR